MTPREITDKEILDFIESHADTLSFAFIKGKWYWDYKPFKIQKAISSGTSFRNAVKRAMEYERMKREAPQ